MRRQGAGCGVPRGRAAGPFAAAIVLASLSSTVPAWAETVRLDAEGAVRRALQVSHLTAAARERVSGAESGTAKAGAARLPVLTAGATAAYRSAVPEFAAPIHGPTEPPVVLFPDIRAAYDLSLEATEALYTGGAVTASLEASRHELDASRADDRGTRDEVALAARLAYWQAAAARAAVDTAESQQRRAERLQADAESLLNAGMAVKADVLGAEARVASAKLAVIRARTAADDALAALRSLLQLPAGDTLELADAMPASLPPEPEPLAALQREARRDRPSLAALEARLAAARARQTVAGAAARPALGASASWELARPNQRYLPLEDRWNDSWVVGLSARWTVWDGGRSRADVAVSEAQQRALAAELGEAQRQVDLEVERGRLHLVSALSAVSAADASRAAAAARHEAEEDRYRAGLATTSDVLAAQADLAAAENDQVAAHTGAWMAAARLERAVGR
jgi:outer membrane protein